MQRESEQRSWGLALALVLFALVFVLTLVRSRPPAPKPTDAPASEFSAARARELLQQLLGDGQPHPVGSEANARVRERILAALALLGYAPQMQRSFVCGGFGTCATVENILARLDAGEPGPAVMLSAHYDSVGAGPGASDDGTGVATLLEVARALKLDPTARHPVIFLFTDGEEAGLFGARAFVAEHPWAREVRAGVNVDNRGSSGPSFMFETSDANRWLIRLYAAVVKRPATSSLFYTIYKRLPNDTDFTVFRRAAIHGFNLAYIGDVAHYHTSLDTVSNASPASLQHHGDTALALVRALANTDLSNPPPGNAVFFDLLGFTTIWWPEEWTRALAIAAVVLFVLVAFALMRRGLLQASPLAWGCFAWLGMIAVSVLLAFALIGALRLAGAFPGQWIAHPAPALVAFWAAAFAGVALVAVVMHRRAGFWGLWAGVWVWWTLLAGALAFAAPGMSYLFLVPALAAGVVALPFTLGGIESRWTQLLVVIVPLLLAASLWCLLGLFLYDALGVNVLPGITALVAVVLTTLAPLIGSVHPRWRWALPSVAGGITLLAAIAALASPAYTPDSPQRLNIVFHQEGESGEARWLVFGDARTVPEPLRAAAPFAGAAINPFPWSTARALAAEAQRVEQHAPYLSVLEKSTREGKWHVRARLISLRGAPQATLYLPATATLAGLPATARLLRLTLQGKPVMPRQRQGWWAATCLTLPPDGIEVELTFAEPAPVELFLSDRSPGLPPAGDALLKARPATAVPSQDGDLTLFTRRLWLNP